MVGTTRLRYAFGEQIAFRTEMAKAMVETLMDDLDGSPAAASRPRKGGRDPKAIRAWAVANGIEVPARGRIPAGVERQYNEAS